MATLRMALKWTCVIVWGLLVANFIRESVPGLATLLSSFLGFALLYIFAYGGRVIHGPAFIEQTTGLIFKFLSESFEKVKLNELLSINLLGIIFLGSNSGKFREWLKESTSNIK